MVETRDCLDTTAEGLKEEATPGSARHGVDEVAEAQKAVDQDLTDKCKVAGSSADCPRLPVAQEQHGQVPPAKVISVGNDPRHRNLGNAEVISLGAGLPS